MFKLDETTPIWIWHCPATLPLSARIVPPDSRIEPDPLPMLAVEKPQVLLLMANGLATTTPDRIRDLS